MPDKKRAPRDTQPTSIRVSPAATRLWERLSAKMGLSKTGVFETAIRELAKREDVKDDDSDAGPNLVS